VGPKNQTPHHQQHQQQERIKKQKNSLKNTLDTNKKNKKRGSIEYNFFVNVYEQSHISMAKVIQETTKKMTQLCRKIVQVDVKYGMLQRVSFVGQFFRFIWNKLMVCSVGRSPAQYRRLSLNHSSSASSSSSSPLSPSPATVDDGFTREQQHTNNGYESDSDLVNLKISLLGDCHIGKTTFLVSKFFTLP